MALFSAINTKFNYFCMNYTEELRKILLEYTKTFKTHLFFETESIFVKLVLEDKSEPKYNFEIMNKTENSKEKFGKPYKAASKNSKNKYGGYLSKNEIYASELSTSSFNDLSQVSVNILKQIQPTQSPLRHRHP